PFGCPLQLKALLAFPLCKQTGKASDNVVEEYLEIFLHLHGEMSSPLKKNMRGIYDTDNYGAAKPPPEAEPESGKDYRDIIEPLEDVVQVVEMQGGQVMEQANAED